MTHPDDLRFWVVRVWPDGFRQVEGVYHWEREARWNANRLCNRKETRDGSTPYIETRDKRSNLIASERVTKASKRAFS